jgi:hypothetical protein
VVLCWIKEQTTFCAREYGGVLLATSRQKQDQTSSSQIFVKGVVTVALLLGKATFPTEPRRERNILAQF